MTKLPPNQQCLIIQLIGLGERYGLDLVRASDGRLRRGGIYVTLDRMEDMGLVSSRQEQPGEVIDRAQAYTGIPRRLYKLTERGLRVRAALALLAEAP